MTTPATPSSGKPAGDDRNLVAVDENYKALTFEDTMHQIWKRNRNLVWALVGLVVIVILGKGGWEYFQHQKELEIEQAYTAATTSEQLKSFAAAHGDHPLAGIAFVRLADEAYTAGKAADAVTNYDKALTIIKDGPLATRAKIGRAMAKVQAGKAADGVADLKQISTDTTQLSSTRAEATYQLAAIAAEAGNADEVQKYSEDLMKIDPGSGWAQRAMMLRASLPAKPAAAVSVPATTSTPAPAATSAPKKDEGSSDMKVKLPGK
jgi:hypothetical protein